MSAAAHDHELAAKLWWRSLLRGIAAAALGAYVLALPPPSAAGLARAVAVYWVVDGLIVLWASLVATRLALNRTLLLLRSAAGVVMALAILGLPLSAAFGRYQPGQLLLLLWVVPLLLLAVGLQILAAIFDMAVWFEVRRHIAGEWSLGLSALLSILFGAILVAVVVIPPPIIGRGLAVVGIAGGIAVVAGALRLRPALDPARSTP